MNTGSRRIIRNTIANIVSYFFLFVSNIFLLPYIVHGIGTEAYGGVWIIIGAITAYIGLVDLGTGTAFLKFIAEYHTVDDEQSLREVVSTGVVMYALFGSLFMLIAWFGGEMILRLVGVPEALLSDAVFVLRVGMLVFVIANVSSPFTSVLSGIQRMELNSIVSIIVQTLYVIGVVIVLSRDGGVRGLILNNLVAMTVNVVLLTWLAFRNVPALRFEWASCRVAMMKRLLTYGFNLQVSKLAQVILFQTDRIVSLRLFGVAAAAYYDIGAKLTNAARTIAALTVSALIPAVAELDARGNSQRLVGLYKRGSKYVTIAASYLFVFIGVFASHIMDAWMGGEYASSIPVVRILAFGYFFNIITGAASTLSAGMGRTELDRKYGVFTAVFNLAAVIGISLLVGRLGVAWGTSLTLILGALYFVRMFHTLIGVRLSEILVLLWKPLLAGLGSALFVFSFTVLFPTGWISSLVDLMVMGSAYSVLYLVLLMFIGGVGREDLQMLTDVFQSKPVTILP